MEVPLVTWTEDQQTYPCFFNTHGKTEARSYEELHQEAKKGCCRCHLLSICCSQYTKGRSDLWVVVIKQENDLFWIIGTEQVSDFSLKPITIQLYYPIGTPQPAWSLVKPGRLSSRGRREGYKALIDAWIESCNSTHKECTVKDAELPHRVLDIGDETNGRIFLHISANQIAPYVALSHCWGSTLVLQTTASTLADHVDGIAYQNLPTSFQDAVAITRSIGVRYLWIDSLCIIQDDKLDWEIESSKMASIYSNAYLVIAASQATDCSEGFIDRKDVNLNNTIQLEPSNSVKIARMENPDSTTSVIYSRRMSTDPTMGKSRHRWKITSSPLNQRGWVLQENILARRIVHFTESEMIWECVKCLRCECMEVESDEAEATHWSEFSMVRNSRITSPTGESVETVNRLYVQWRKLIGLYGRLILTKDNDRLPALSGLAKLYQSQGAGKYFAGLWENDLLKSLVWHIRTDEPVHRWKEYVAPSWSPFSVGYIKGRDGLIEAGYWYCYDEGYHERWGEPHAKILEASCDPAGKDPTGAVKDGFLVLRGPVRKDEPEKEDNSWMAANSNDLWQWNIWKYVFWDRPREKAEQSEILFFLLWADLNKGYIKALCLEPVANVPGTYTRIGIVDSHVKDQGLGDFFKDLEEGEVRLV